MPKNSFDIDPTGMERAAKVTSQQHKIKKRKRKLININLGYERVECKSTCKLSIETTSRIRNF